MTLRTPFTTTRFILTLAAPLAVSGTASAEVTCGELTCPTGYECRSAPSPCPAIDCPEGSECPPCESEEYSYCSPLPCSSDADCASDMLCHSAEVTECTGETAPCVRPDDGGDPECPPPEDPECTTTRVSQCVPRWFFPCESASDCGAGFTCEETEECGCSGSGGSSGAGIPTPSDGGSSEPVPEEPRPAADAGTDSDCTCRPSGEFTCRAIERACALDSDCEEGWTCVDNPEGVCSSSSDGTISCEPADPARLCAPPYAEVVGGGRGVSVDDEGSGKSAPGSDSGSERGDSDGANSSAERSDGGCSVGNVRRGGTGAFALLVAGLALSLRRRTGAPSGR